MKKLILFIGVILTSFLLSYSWREFTVDEELIKIAQSYKNYHRFELTNWTILRCKQSGNIPGDTLLMSKVPEQKSPHGDKVYKFYVKDLNAYVGRMDPQPEGQVMVKEVWNVRQVELENDSIRQRLLDAKLSRVDGKYYTPTTVKQLFIMYKTGPSKENDNGWYYGIVDVEKGVEQSRVIESGKVNNCMKCHQESKYDRIIGVQ